MPSSDASVADVLVFVFSEEYYGKSNANRGKAELIVAKHRNGPTDTALVGLEKEFTRFTQLQMEDL